MRRLIEGTDAPLESGVRVNVTELASAEGSPTAEISGTQSCSRSVVIDARAARRRWLVRQRPRLAREHALGHLQPAQAERLAVGARAEVGALLRPLDDFVLVAVVPPVEDELVEPRDAVLDERRERVVARQKCDELVGVAQRPLKDTEAPGRERDRGRSVARVGR